MVRFVLPVGRHVVVIVLSHMLLIGSQGSAFAKEIKVVPTEPGTGQIASQWYDLRPTWIWQPSITSDNVPFWYQVEWSQDQTFKSGVSYASVSTPQFTHEKELSKSLWYLRVKAISKTGAMSSYSALGQVNLEVSDILAPVSVSAYLNDDNALLLAWSGCNAQRFRVYKSSQRPDYGYSQLGEYTDWNVDLNLASGETSWFYITSLDPKGRESFPSRIVEVKGNVLVPQKSLGDDLFNIFKPIYVPLEYFI